MGLPSDCIVVSCAKLRGERHIWLASTYDACSRGEPEFYGYVEGFGDCLGPLEEAYSKLKALHPEFPVQRVRNKARMNLDASFARSFHSKLAAKKRLERPASKSTGHTPLEFVYRRGIVTDGEHWSAVNWKHQILRKTVKKIVVHRRVFRPGHVWSDTRAFHLDRAKLERDGYVFHGVEKFSLKPETLPVTTSGNSDAELLGVSLPCSLRELQRAFRVKVKTAHPDRGGDDGSFIALRSAFVRLKRLATS